MNGIVDADLQAAYLAHWYLLAAGQSSLLFANWFEWQCNALSGDIETCTNGVKAPNEAGIALEVIQGWIVNQAVSACQQQGNIWSCAIGANLVVWDASQTCSNGVCTTAAYDATGYSQCEDIAGNVESVSGSIQLGIKPILLKP